MDPGLAVEAYSLGAATPDEAQTPHFTDEAARLLPALTTALCKLEKAPALG